MPAQNVPHSSPRVSFPGPNYVYWGRDSLYVNLTSRCSAACAFCLRNFTWDVFGYDLMLQPTDEPSARQVIRSAIEALKVRKPAEVVFTGLGEPTLRLDELLEVLVWAGSLRLLTRLDTNGHGQLLNPGRNVARELAVAGLDAASVSLNASDADTYGRLCGPSVAGAFAAVQAFIVAAVAEGTEVTATAVAVPGVDTEAIRRLAESLGASFRVRPLLTKGSSAG